MAQKIKTAKIELESIKSSDGWYSLGNELGLSEEKIYEVFEYGEFGSLEIEVDEHLNIVGGRIIPSGKK
jgi:hypothetical protein